MPPDLISPPSGCRFHPRCEIAHPRLRRRRPAADPLGGGRATACRYHEELAAACLTAAGAPLLEVRGLAMHFPLNALARAAAARRATSTCCAPSTAST